MRSAIAFLAVMAVAGCSSPGTSGPPGPQGEQGVQGAKGDPGAGWSASGDTVYSTNAGSVGIGTSSPTAKLHVAGALRVDDDASLLPTWGCRQVLLDLPSADLGDLLKPYLILNRCIDVTLKASTSWTWNKRIDLIPGQRLSIVGEGYQNGAQNLTVVINMTTHPHDTPSGGPECHEPTRVVLNDGSTFILNGVRLSESAGDATPLCPYGNGGALFGSVGAYSLLDVSQIRIDTDESVAGVGSRAFLNVRFGHTFIDRHGAATKVVNAAQVNTGWAFAGGFGFVHRSHTTLGTGITWQATSKLTYSD